MPRWVVANEDNEEESSDETSGEEGEDEEEQSEEEEDKIADEKAGSSRKEADETEPAAKRQKISLQLGKGKLVCHVCGKAGHCAGFQQSVYIDCPNKPCYLCKRSGHTTMTCPYRMAPDHECKHATAEHGGILSHVFERSTQGRLKEVNFPIPNYQVDAAVLKLHSRRCTCMQFHPTNDQLVITGDKSGQVAVWNHTKVYERTVWKMNSVMTNNLGFLSGPSDMSWCCSSSDGTVKVFDLEVGQGREVLNLQPDGWIRGVHTSTNWKMIYGLDASHNRGLIAAGDSKGSVYFIDARTSNPVGNFQMHKKGNKVTSIQFSPVDCNLLLSASNDWTARLSDLRNLSSSSSDSKGKDETSSPTELAVMDHPKVVNSAYFSPVTGRKILTTCIDNRIRVWDYLMTADKAPQKEIVHSQDFNRYLTPFRAEWDAKDANERLIICGRYISEDFGGQALHPIDIMDAQTGLLMLQLKDPNLPTITPVNKFHPRLDLIVSGSSRSLYAWKPVPTDAELLDMSALKSGNGTLGKDGSLQGSASYVFYDAGLQGDDLKKKKKGKGATEIDDESDEDDSPKKPKRKAKPKTEVKESKPKVSKTQKPSADSKKKKDDSDKGKKGKNKKSPA